MWAAVFPGQGSQQVGMGQFLCDHFSVAREAFEESSDALSIDMKKLCFNGPESDLALTENTQPCLLTVSVTTFRVLESLVPLKLTSGAGHSIGEYAAVVSSGAMAFADALRAVRTRGQAMQSAVPVGEGGMLATLGLDENQVKELCQWTVEKSGFSPLEPANFNAPGQIVVSGSAKAIEWLTANYTDEIFATKPRRVKLIPLKVSAPFHCSLMKPAEEKMARVLSEIAFTEPRFPIVQNVHGQAVSEPEKIRENLIQQISSPVLWIQCVKQMQALGAQKLIEFGCGQVIAGLIKKIDRENLVTFNVNNLDELKEVEKQCQNA